CGRTEGGMSMTNGGDRTSDIGRRVKAVFDVRYPMSAVRLFFSFGENVSLALGALRVAKMRSALTILGVVIGVSCVMALASFVRGIQDQILNTLEVSGPSTFYVVKVFSQTPLNPENLPKWVRIRPNVSWDEAERIAKLPEIGYAALWGQMLNKVEYRGTRTGLGLISGADEGYPEIYGGDLTEGRWFTRAEEAAGSAVTVLESNVARKLFG